jgi:uncharacterized protein DUF4326
MSTFKFRFKSTHPTLVNVRATELRKLGYSNIQEWLNANPNHLYIGRNMRISLGCGQWCYLPNSKWHNPFKSGDRDRIVYEYEDYARKRFSSDEILELKGKVLGCWCTPKPCHGDILIKLYRETSSIIVK